MSFVECPHCERMCGKDDNCNYVFACGLSDKGFIAKHGCGRPFCFQCGKKFCGIAYDPETGRNLKHPNNHTKDCCSKEPDFNKMDYCPGGHNSHCPRRWYLAPKTE